MMASMDSAVLHPEVLKETKMLELISGFATPAEWLMLSQGLIIFGVATFVYAWISGEW